MDVPARRRRWRRRRRASATDKRDFRVPFQRRRRTRVSNCFVDNVRDVRAYRLTTVSLLFLQYRLVYIGIVLPAEE